MIVELGSPKTFLLEPVPAPRMTRAARWSDEPGVVRFKAFCKEVRRRELVLPVPFAVQFFFQLPRESLRRGHPELRHHAPHTRKPDTDNLVKGLIDAVYHGQKGGDSHVHCLLAAKLWTEAESHFIVWPMAVNWPNLEEP